MVDHVIIMAGGAGKRLWPASHDLRPKQFMTVQGDDSLFRGTINRAAALDISGYIVVVTHQNHIQAALEDAEILPPAVRDKLVLLAEPQARNTGPALAYAASWLKEKTGRDDSSVLVLAADHLIQDVGQFRDDVENADKLAGQGYLVVYGIQPDFPSTGYGYIEAGEPQEPGFQVLSFREKPDRHTAQEFLDAGRYFWNSGMFTYRLSVFMDELNALTPEMAKPFLQSFSVPPEQNDEGIVVVNPDENLTDLYRSLPSDSVDYAVMEKSGRIAMVPAGFDWNDVGSWDVIADLGPEPNAPVFEKESRNNFVYSDIPVALCGVEDLIVVHQNGKLLICRKGMSQLVKGAAEFLLEETQ